ncbi:uncharacterized protein LOC112195007 isoform X2 [Rosa chinensis]|nr:uncharacterized protein LOC112195007 isoform X2 [Rosa chinensis]
MNSNMTFLPLVLCNFTCLPQTYVHLAHAMCCRIEKNSTASVHLECFSYSLSRSTMASDGASLVETTNDMIEGEILGRHLMNYLDYGMEPIEIGLFLESLCYYPPLPNHPSSKAVSRTGLNIIVACNIPKNNPMIEVCALSISHTYSETHLRILHLSVLFVSISGMIFWSYGFCIVIDVINLCNY